MQIISKKKLVKILNERFKTSITDHDLSYEAFGKEVFAFIWDTEKLFGKGVMRSQVRAAVESAGGEIGEDSWCQPQTNKVSVPVSYFKAWHWDE